jgi:hypothetical protein
MREGRVARMGGSARTGQGPGAELVAEGAEPELAAVRRS